jgi:hypothetical protein
MMDFFSRRKLLMPMTFDGRVDRRKLDFVTAAKLIPWNDVRGEEDFRLKTGRIS